MKELHLIVSGKVQGVYYRQSTLEKALSLNLTGWVQNLVNGHVEVLAQGQEEDLKSLIAWCRKGPAQADVKEVQSKWQEPSQEFLSFEIKR